VGLSRRREKGVMRMKEKRLYVAYGSNLNKLQMRQRCPDAVPYGRQNAVAAPKGLRLR